ncbi:MAG: tetratricopeptide repeat protein [Planctomycetota bacterium]|nr:tetratricopeptide repeat protein [Planctomycetota bacterium]
MSKLLEILGRAINFDTADLIWHWLNEASVMKEVNQSAQYRQLAGVVELIGINRLDSAEGQLNHYLLENPCCTYGHLAAAAILLQKNELLHALEELETVYFTQPNNTMCLYAMGHCNERLGRESRAIEFYQDCLKFKNYLQPPRQRIAAIYFKNGRLENTIQEYELLKKEYPDDMATLVTLGHLYIVNKKYIKAIDTFNTAILSHPDNFYSEDDETEMLISDGQLQDAMERLQDLLQEQPDRADLIVRQADILGMTGATSETVSRYKDAIRICPDYLEATIKLGTQYLKMQNNLSAAQQFNRAVEINDQIVDAYVGLATAQKECGKIEDALATLSLAKAIEPNSTLLFSQTAALQFKIEMESAFSLDNENELDETIEAVIAAHLRQTSAETQNPDLYYRIGLLMVAVHRYEDAIKAFETALEIKHTHTRAKNKLAICLLETGQNQDALYRLTTGDCIDKDTLNLHYKTALLYCDRIKFASSLINLEKYMQDNFACANATVNVSIVLQNLGLLDRASAMWDSLTNTANQAINSENTDWPSQF